MAVARQSPVVILPDESILNTLAPVDVATSKMPVGVVVPIPTLPPAPGVSIRLDEAPVEMVKLDVAVIESVPMVTVPPKVPVAA